MVNLLKFCCRNRKLLFVIALFSATLFAVKSLLPFPPTTAATDNLITITQITPGSTATGTTNTTLTTSFKFNKEFVAGGDASIVLELQRVTGYFGAVYELSAAAGDIGHFQIQSTSADINTDITLAKEFADGYLTYTIGGLNENITADTVVELQLTGVTLPSTAGRYSFKVTATDNNSEEYTLLPADDNTRADSFGLGEACMKIKTVDPSDDAVAAANVHVHNIDFSTNASSRTDYNGEYQIYPQEFSVSESCPSGSTLYIEVQKPADSSGYANPSTKQATLPDDKTTYYDSPIAFGAIQIQGTLIDGSTDGALSDTEVIIRPASFGDPSAFHFAQSNSEGIFQLGALPDSVYTLEFQTPFGSSNPIVAPSAIETVTVSDGKVTLNYGGVECDAAATCDLGEVTYPEATKSVSGYIKDEDGNAITSGQVEAFKDMGFGWTQTTIDTNDGSYELSMGGGTWMVMPLSGGDPEQEAEWTYCGMPKMISFTNDQSVENKTSANSDGYTDFTVKKATVTVTGQILKPDGTAFTSGEVQIRSKDGCGAFGRLDGSGEYSVKVPSGSYTVSVMVWGDNNYGAPSAENINVKSGTYTVDDLTLVEKKDTISGRVWADVNDNASYDSGEGRSSVRIEAFKMSKKFDEFGGPGGGPGPGGNFVSTNTGSSGTYSLKVTSGMWMVNVMLDPGMMGGYSTTETNYIYTGSPLQVNVSESDNGNTYGDKDFQVSVADATIKGQLVDTDGNGVSGVYGYAFADTGGGPAMGVGMGAPIKSSAFTIKVPAGTYDVGVDFPPESSGYTAADMTEVTLSAGETKNVDVTVKPNDSRIKVNFVDAGGSAVKTLSSADVFLESSGGGHIFKMLHGSDLSTGSTTINVCEGTWRIGYFINPTNNDYMSEPIATDNTVTVTTANDDSNPAEVNITLQEANATISGQITDPDGNALAGAWISTDNRKASGFDKGGPMFMMGEASDENGNYSITLPAGTYKVQSFLPPSMGYINPDGQEATVGEDETKTVNLQFGQSDATITGSVYLNDSKKGAFISAYSANGGYSEATTSSGDYTLNVTKNDTWYVKAMYETSSNFYRSDLQEVAMSGSTNKSQNLTMSQASFTLPSSVSSTFDYTNAKQVSLSNGFNISIPANAIQPTSNATGNNITITINPTAQLSNQNQSLPVGVGYDITAVDDSGSTITSTFNSPVTITIPYSEDYLTDVLGTADESLLENGYWDDSTSTWKGLTGASIDTDANTISFTTNHFTTFSALTGSTAVSSTDDSAGDSDETSRTSTSSGGNPSPPIPIETGAVRNFLDNWATVMVGADAIGWDARIEGWTDSDNFGLDNPTPPLWITDGPYKIALKSWDVGAQFWDLEKPITLILRYNPHDLGVIPESTLRVNYYDEAEGRWRPISSLLIADRNELAIVTDKLHNYYAIVGGYGWQGTSYKAEETVTATTTTDQMATGDDLNEVAPTVEPTTEPTLGATDQNQDSQPQPATDDQGRELTWFGRLVKKVVSFFKR